MKMMVLDVKISETVLQNLWFTAVVFKISLEKGVFLDNLKLANVTPCY